MEEALVRLEALSVSAYHLDLDFVYVPALALCTIVFSEGIWINVVHQAWEYWGACQLVAHVSNPEAFYMYLHDPDRQVDTSTANDSARAVSCRLDVDHHQH